MGYSGGANSKVWTQMLADASKKNVLISNTVEAPDINKKQQYDDLLGIYKEVYFSNKKINNKLVNFSVKSI